jgi:hypothetical protein
MLTHLALLHRVLDDAVLLAALDLTSHSVELPEVSVRAGRKQLTEGFSNLGR